MKNQPFIRCRAFRRIYLSVFAIFSWNGIASFTSYLFFFFIQALNGLLFAVERCETKISPYRFFTRRYKYVTKRPEKRRPGFDPWSCRACAGMIFSGASQPPHIRAIWRPGKAISDLAKKMLSLDFLYLVRIGRFGGWPESQPITERTWPAFLLLSLFISLASNEYTR